MSDHRYRVEIMEVVAEERRLRVRITRQSTDVLEMDRVVVARALAEGGLIGDPAPWLSDRWALGNAYRYVARLEEGRADLYDAWLCGAAADAIDSIPRGWVGTTYWLGQPSDPLFLEDESECPDFSTCSVFKPLWNASSSVVRRLVFSPDGHTLLVHNDDGEIRLLHARSYEERFGARVMPRGANAAFAPDGGIVVENGREFARLALSSLHLMTYPRAFGVQASRDARVFLRAKGASALIQRDDGSTLREEPRDFGATLAAFDRYGRHGVLYTLDGELLLFGLERVARQVLPSFGTIYAIAMSDDGEVIALRCGDGFLRVIRRDGRLLRVHRFDRPSSCSALCFAPRGALLIGYEDGVVEAFSLGGSRDEEIEREREEANVVTRDATDVESVRDDEASREPTRSADTNTHNVSATRPSASWTRPVEASQRVWLLPRSMSKNLYAGKLALRLVRIASSSAQTPDPYELMAVQLALVRMGIELSLSRWLEDKWAALAYETVLAHQRGDIAWAERAFDRFEQRTGVLSREALVAGAAAVRLILGRPLFVSDLLKHGFSPEDLRGLDPKVGVFEQLALAVGLPDFSLDLFRWGWFFLALGETDRVREILAADEQSAAGDWKHLLALELAFDHPATFDAVDSANLMRGASRDVVRQLIRAGRHEFVVRNFHDTLPTLATEAFRRWHGEARNAAYRFLATCKNPPFVRDVNLVIVAARLRELADDLAARPRPISEAVQVELAVRGYPQGRALASPWLTWQVARRRPEKSAHTSALKMSRRLIANAVIGNWAKVYEQMPTLSPQETAQILGHLTLCAMGRGDHAVTLNLLERMPSKGVDSPGYEATLEAFRELAGTAYREWKWA